jgi:hypothetical protein
MVSIIGRKIPTTGAGGSQSSGIGGAFDRLAAVLADPLTPELKRQKLREMERQNVEKEAFSRGLAGGETDLALQSARGAAAGLKPDETGGFIALPTLGRPGADISSTGYAQAMMMGGKDYKNTPHSFYAAPQNVLSPEGRPTVAPLSKSYGMEPVLPLGQVQGAFAAKTLASPTGLAGLDAQGQQFVGAAPSAGTPRNYVKDGVNFITNDGMTDARTGQPLPQGGYLASPQGSAKDVGINQTVQSGLQTADLARQRFKGLLDYTRNIAAKDSTLFGAAGVARNLVQEGVQLAGNVAQMFGAADIREAQAKARNMAIQSTGVSPNILNEMFDPNLPAIVSAAHLLAFQGAAALAGQSGRDLSDRDLIIMRQVFGDPRSLLESRESFMAKLKTAEDIVDSMAAADKQFQGGAAAAQPTAPPAAAPQAAPTSAPQQPERWDYVNGVLQRVQ